MGDLLRSGRCGANATKSPRSTRLRIASRSGANARSRSQNGTSARISAIAAGERRRRRERPAQLDALRRGEQLDRDDARGVRRHRRQPARGERRHADVILLVRGRRQRIDGGRVRERLVLRGERRRGDLRDHEAGIHAAVLDQERRQARQVGVHQQRDAPLRQRADLGDREREIVGGERDRLGVEIAAGEDLAGRREHERIVGDRVRLGQRGSRRRGASGRGTRPSPAAGSAGCRDPARAGNPCATRGSRCRRAARGRSPRHPPGRGGRAPRGCARRTACRCRGTRRPTARPRRRPPRSRARAANRPASASAVDTCVPLRSARPSFGPSVTGARPARAQRLARRHRRGRRSRASPSPISTAERCASGARSPDAPTEPCAGMHGTTPALASARSASITVQRTPE